MNYYMTTWEREREDNNTFAGCSMRISVAQMTTCCQSAVEPGMTYHGILINKYIKIA